MELTPGARFAGYTVVSRLGHGGMGTVYLVHNPTLDRHEALKVIGTGAGLADDFADRFAREARTVAGLHHPSIITVHAFGVENDVPWFTMSYLDGHDLTGARLPYDEMRHVSRDVASALDYAHRKGVIHRDIKPANVFLTRDDDEHLESVTVLDFGIARLADATGLTGTGAFIGTLAYSAPETIEGRPPSPASDQYSLACTVYQLLTGRPPFTGDSPVAVMRAHADTPAPAVSAFRPDLAHLDPVFARALAKDPADRFRSCREFAAALEASPPASGAGTEPTARLGPPVPRFPPPAGPNPAFPPPPRPLGSIGVPPRPPHPVNRSTRRGLIIGGAVVAVVVLVAAIDAFFAFGGRDDDPEPVDPLNNAVLATSKDLSCAITGNTANGGDLYCWGYGGRES